jgi:two-component system osmolarity sensor histidine kinase EnvZ
MTSFLKKVLPKSIFARFLLILTAPVVLSQFIFSVFFSEKYTQVILGIISRQMAGEAIGISQLLDMKCDEIYINKLKKSMNLDIEVINDAKLQKTGISKNHTAYRVLRRALRNKGYENYYIRTNARDMEIYIPSNNNQDVYKISFPRKNLYMKFIPLVLGSGIVSSLILLIVAFVFLKNQIRPIKKLAKAAEDFGKGYDTTDYTPEGAKEVRMAGMAFCEMKQNVKTLMDDRMRILAGISHDLRTPLTKMKLQLSLMPKTKETEWLKSDVNMMIKMTESFTLQAAEQNKEIFIHRNLNSLLNEIIRDYENEDFKIYINGDKTINVLIKYLSLKRAFGNIIANAKKYSKNLYISFNKVNDQITIQFEDDGEGVDEKNLNIIFSPFKKENPARTHDNAQGVGLGLSIARDAIIANGGEIKASRSKRYGGACFTVTFPFRI